MTSRRSGPPPHVTLNMGRVHGEEGQQQRASVDSNGSPNISPLSENPEAAYELISDTDEAEQPSRRLLSNQQKQAARQAPRSFKWHQRLVPCIFLAFLAIYVFGYHAGPTTEMFDKLKSTFKPGGSSESNNAAVSQNGSGGMRNIAYFTNWAIYGRKHRPQDLPAQDLTHVLYAFANVRPESGEVYLSDAWADEQIHWEGDSWNDVGTNLYGCFKQLYLLKKQNPALKVLLSIGGWTYSSNFAPMASQPNLRAEFARSAVNLLETYGLDGLDIDWEYPENDSQAADYVSLLKDTRQALDQHAQSKGESQPYELSIAAPGAPSKYEILRIKEMDKYLSFWNLMLYDFAGSWDSTAGHAANLHSSSVSSFAGDKAVAYYHKKGVPNNKLVVGMPLYGRSFLNTDGPGQPYSGVGQGSWEAGVWDYKALPLPGSTVQEDKNAGASWCYNPSNREMVSYDTPHMGEVKASWIKDQKLGGAMYWESSADFPQGHPDRMIGKVADTLFKAGKDESPNHLNFPGSKFDNLRKKMEA